MHPATPLGRQVDGDRDTLPHKSLEVGGVADCEPLLSSSERQVPPGTNLWP